MSSKKIAFLFPGQGSQSVGMGRELYEKFPVARAVFDEADAALGFPLSQLCFEGPEEKLKLTEHTQPAILTVSVAAARVLAGHGITAAFTGARRRWHADLRRCSEDRAQPRPLHAAGGSGRAGCDGGDTLIAHRQNHCALRAGRAGDR